MSANPTFDAIVTSTLRKYHRKLQENLMGHNALLWTLRSKGYTDTTKGGRSIVQPLLYALNTTVRSYDSYDVLDNTPQDGISAAEYKWKYISGSVTISGQEEFENSGKEKIFSLLEAKIKQLEISMQLEINKQLLGDGTGNGGKDITGLGIAVENGSAWSTYGGIDRSDAANAFWRNQWFDFDTEMNGGTPTTFSATKGVSTMGLAAMRRMFLSCSIGHSAPDLILTTRDIVEEYEAQSESKHRLTSTKLADAGFRSMEYKGVDMIPEDELAAENMLFLNSEFLRFKIGSGRDFVSTPFVRPNNQDAKTSHVQFAGNLTVLKSDQLGRIDGITV